MILLIGGEKGGTGKSTISTNIASYLSFLQEDVLIVDSDPQLTSSKWVARRKKNYPDLLSIHCIQKTGDIFETVKDVALRYKNVIIDAGGRDSEELRTAMLIARKMYIPIRASQPDLETLSNMGKLVSLAKGMNRSLDARIILSIAPTNHLINEVKEARALLNNFSHIRMSKCIIYDRKIYRDTMSEGLGVIESESGKAKQEIKLLAQEIYS